VSGDNVKILLVEDNADIREGLMELLESEGYSVSNAGSAEDGLARLRQESFQLVITDYIVGRAPDAPRQASAKRARLSCG
jgi:CheY-like chemotaxis protein